MRIPTPAPRPKQRGRKLFFVFLVAASLLNRTISASPSLPGTGSQALSGLQNGTEPLRIRLSIVGDMMLARGPGLLIGSGKSTEIFSPGKVLLAGSDIVAGNLECAISDRGEPAVKRYRFRAPVAAASALADAGYHIVTLANNHGMDYGPEALLDTIRRLRAAGIMTVGAGNNDREARKPLVLERGSMRIAFLGYADVPVESSGFNIRSWEAGPGKPGIAIAREGDITADVALAATLADAVVVLLHAGTEGLSSPGASQRRLAESAIAAGATIVACSHSHVAGTGEWRKGSFIAWGLGNWIFDGFEPGKESGTVLKAVLQPGFPGEKAVLVSVELLPKPAQGHSKSAPQRQ